MSFERFLAVVRRTGAGFPSDEPVETLWLAAAIGAPVGIRTAAGTVPTGAPDGAGGPAPVPPAVPNRIGLDDPAAAPPAMGRAAPVVAAQREGHPARGTPVALPTAPPLPRTRQLQRALRPFRTERRSPWRTEFDEAATISRVAQRDLWLPAFRPTADRWFDLVLVVDAGSELDLWRDVATALGDLFEQFGGFRDVRTQYLHQVDADVAASGLGVSGSPLRTAVLRSPSELVDPTGRRVVLLLTDGVSDIWRTTPAVRAVRRWAAAGPLAILQPLPERLWNRTNLATSRVHLRARMPGAPTATLTVRDQSTGTTLGGAGAVAVPVLEIEPAWLAAYSRLVNTGQPMDGAVARVGEVARRGADGGQPAGISPTERVARFRAGASVDAYLLAGFLSEAPLTLGLMRTIQAAMLPHAKPSTLAEVIFSGLIAVEGQVTGGSAADVRFAFADGVAEVLTTTLRRQHSAEVANVVSAYLTRARGVTGGNLRAVVLDDEAPAEFEAVGAPFAALEPDAVERFRTEPRAEASPAAEAPPPVPAPTPADPKPRGWLASLFRRRQAKPPVERESLLSRFGQVCPACGAALGAAPAVLDNGRFTSPPSFRLEIGPPTSERRYPWRVSAVGADHPSARSMRPEFNPHEVDYVYLLCGGGHFFPDAAPVYYRDDEHSFDAYNMIAAIGAPASGKTYLLLRMLHQRLDRTAQLPARPDDDSRISQYQLSPLEQIPMEHRSQMYNRTLVAGDAIEPTMMDRWSRPAGILEDQLPEALAAIHEFVRRTVVNGQRRAGEWGKGFRQPLVMRTRSRDRRTWTGVADLPGELFDPDDVSPRERVRLRNFDALIWVVDPLVASTMDAFAEGSPGAAAAVLDGSLRTGTTAAADLRTVLGRREVTQMEIGRQLTLIDGRFDSDDDVQLLVAISKIDLVHTALSHRSLTDLGQPGEVLRGVARYLAALARALRARALRFDPHASTLLQHLSAEDVGAAPGQRYLQLASSLLQHYSSADAFWNLAHTGRADTVGVADRGDPADTSYTVHVASIGEHLDYANVPGQAADVQIRDVVMSALGCGITYGLGHEPAVYRLLQEPRLRLRFFLCSALGAVPEAVDDEDLPRIRPLRRTEGFARLPDRSAGLTQLLHAALEKARG